MTNEKLEKTPRGLDRFSKSCPTFPSLEVSTFGLLMVPKLLQVFAEADEDGGGGLDMEEFRQAMRQSMGKNVSDQDLDQIFMKGNASIVVSLPYS